MDTMHWWTTKGRKPRVGGTSECTWAGCQLFANVWCVCRWMSRAGRSGRHDHSQGDMGRRGRDKHRPSKSETISMAANLEVISAENFQRRLEGMSSCQDCMKQRVQEACPASSTEAHHGRRRRKGSQQRLHSPIVVRLQDTIKVSIRGRPGRPPPRSDHDSDHSTSSDDTHCKKEVVSLNNICQMSRSLQSLRDDKNFNAFLSAIERVHLKDHESLSANLEEFVRTAKDKKALSSQVNFLNNAMLYHSSISDKEQAVLRRSLDFLDKENVELICNDLSSKNSTVDSEVCSEDTSESSSVISTSDSPSDTDVSTDSVSDELSREELERLTDYTTGHPLTKYDCPPQECPECLAAYYAYTSNYWYGDECEVTTSSESDFSDEEEARFSVRVVGQGKVEVSVGPLSSCRKRQQHQQQQRQRYRKQQHYMRAPPVPPPPPLINSVYVDLTELNVTLSVEYHQDNRDTDHHRHRQPPQQQQHHHYHAPLYPWEWLGSPWGFHGGYMMWPLPYFLLPIYYIPYPLITMPKPLCVPRNTKCLQSQRLCMVPAQEIKTCKLFIYAVWWKLLLCEENIYIIGSHMPCSRKIWGLLKSCLQGFMAFAWPSNCECPCLLGMCPSDKYLYSTPVTGMVIGSWTLDTSYIKL